MVAVARSGVLALVVLATLGGAASADPAGLALCVEEPQTERSAGNRLNAWLPGIGVRLVPRGDCAAAGSAFRGWFQGWEQVELVLVNRAGVRRARRIPWLRRRRRALAALEDQGMLAVFSVLLHGLITEINLSWLLDDPPRLPAGPDALPAEERVLAAAERPPRHERPGLLAASLTALRVVPPSPPVPRRAATDQRAAQIQQQPQTGRVTPVAEPRHDPRPPTGVPVALAAPARPRPRPIDEPGVGRSRPRRPPARRRAPKKPPRSWVVVEKESRRVPATPREGSSAVTKRVHWTVADLVHGFSLQAHLAGRWRDSDLFSWEVGGALSWRGLFFRAGYQPPAEWSLSGNPVEVTAVPLAAGWRPALWRRRRWMLRAETAALVERFNLRRLNLERAADHSHWDAGLALGLGLEARLTGDLWAGATLTGFWFPAAQEISIENGPSARLTRLGARAALSLFWDPGGN